MGRSATPPTGGEAMHYTIKANSLVGPIHLLSPLTLAEAVQRGAELEKEGFFDVLLVNLESQAELPLDQFARQTKESSG
jgi:hypothetical protein